MSRGRIAAAVLVLAALGLGGAMYYLQVYGYYSRLPVRDTLTLATEGGPQNLAVSGYEGIDSASSPLRRRECFTLSAAPEGLLPYARPEPLLAPRWFSCFDAAVLGADLAAGRARAVLAEGNFIYGFDRVMALYPDGRARLWAQVNACGTAHFDGRPLPEGCPPAP